MSSDHLENSPRPSAVEFTIKQPTIFLDLALAPKGTPVPDGVGLPDRQALEQVLIEKALNPFLTEIAAELKAEQHDDAGEAEQQAGPSAQAWPLAAVSDGGEDADQDRGGRYQNSRKRR